ncbi:unnamed protein product [Microthlaspi erraticum]|uniref:Uncharacterized protein n=1 Tax=Microthlaspi erraticum TaxID=1685480 RepID=A0A6D2HM20_9BRAS|nr:unnamed protein product [Microthlaspi erraticum]
MNQINQGYILILSSSGKFQNRCAIFVKRPSVGNRLTAVGIGDKPKPVRPEDIQNHMVNRLPPYHSAYIVDLSVYHDSLTCSHLIYTPLRFAIGNVEVFGCKEFSMLVPEDDARLDQTVSCCQHP